MTDTTAIVFEPHNDDFIIGMGGTGLKLLEAGWDIVSVVLTDGRFGSDELSPETTRTVRADEKHRETERLGTEHVDLGLHDQSLQRKAATTEDRESICGELADVLERVDPSVAFIPARAEGHPDHQATNELVVDAVSSHDADVALIEYVVWNLPFLDTPTSEVETVVKVGVDETYERKVSTIRVHGSQIREYPFDEIATSFNRYLGSIYDPYSTPEFVELFHVRDGAETPKTFYRDAGAEEVTGQFHRFE